ncbi:MAG: hypothetical protein GWN18_02640 [Thermoplasmata archaeon]|nr:hypothetical protein [Thermoplasmata archaeon]NIS10907.1 hypothetical protein [Thermoplasmata archaeon]NIS18837.1 hypothetical protein [Thermoplasmata archaeon]NIT75863.1 hypothetical protein [Thermoplasmata archaeon]NIU47997.1 hypothetical protein [Thermoplasmata archaeon]
MTFNDLVIYALLLFGLYLLLMDVKMWFAPHKKGRIVAVEDQVGTAERDCNCGTIKNCRSHLTATVRTEDGDLVQTDMSPCLVCMDRVRLGSQIGLHRIGDRWIGRRYIDLLGRGLENDEEPIELETCSIKGVAE